MKKFFTKSQIKSFIVINIGLILVAFPFVFYFNPHNIIYGGISALAIVIRNFLGNPDWLYVSYIILALNALLLLAAFYFLGKNFFIKTVYGSLAYPVYTYLLEIAFNALNKKTDLFTNPLNSEHQLLFIVFFAAMSGAGLGLTLKQDASTGGVDILQAIFLKFIHLPYSISLVIIDGAIILIGCLYMAGGINYQALMGIMHGVIIIFVTGRVLDSIVFSGFNSRAVHIITQQHQKVKMLIYDLFGRGVTEVYVRGGFSGNDSKMLICVMNSREFNILRAKIKTVDDNAFLYVVKAAEVHGEGFSFVPTSEE